MAHPFQCCNEEHDHKISPERLREEMLSDDEFFEAADLFKLFGDSTRLKILFLLSLSELCVCDITAMVGMTQSAVSHQLRVLKSARLIKYRKEGKTVFYSLADDHVKTILAQGLEHIAE